MEKSDLIIFLGKKVFLKVRGLVRGIEAVITRVSDTSVSYTDKFSVSSIANHDQIERIREWIPEDQRTK